MAEQRTILLVEDEAIVALNERAMLRRGGYAVITVHTGEAAVEAVDEHLQIELVLMDINLGAGIDGTEAAQRILAKRDLPLVFLSSHTEPAIVRRTEGITSYGYIVKHTGETVLLASITMAFRLYEAKLRERETAEELEQYFSNSLDLLCISTMDGRFVRLNPEWERVLGYPADELVGRRFLDFVHPDDLQPTIAAIARLRSHREIEGFENRCRHRDGSYRWIEWRSRPIGSTIYAAARDVTERRRTEDELRRLDAARASDERLRLITEVSPVGIVVSDGRERMIYHNQRFVDLFGYTSEDVPDVDCWFGLAYPDAEERERIRVAWAHAMEQARVEHGEIVPVETTVTCRDGTARDVEFRFKTNGEYNVVVFTDITSRKRAELRVEALLREKELLLRESRHRVKNNMGVIKSLLLLQAGSIQDSSCVDALRRATGSVQSMLTLDERLHDLEQYTELSARAYLPPLIRQIVELFSDTRSVGVTIEIEDIVLPTQVLSPLGIIVNELITNTMKHAFPEAEAEAEAGTIRVAAERVGDEIGLTYSDDGVGMPETVVEDRSLGLLIIRSLVDQIGGEMRIDRDHGTTVEIVFPGPARP